MNPKGRKESYKHSRVTTNKVCIQSNIQAKDLYEQKSTYSLKYRLETWRKQQFKQPQYSLQNRLEATRVAADQTVAIQSIIQGYRLQKTTRVSNRPVSYTHLTLPTNREV